MGISGGTLFILPQTMTAEKRGDFGHAVRLQSTSHPSPHARWAPRTIPTHRGAGLDRRRLGYTLRPMDGPGAPEGSQILPSFCHSPEGSWVLKTSGTAALHAWNKHPGRAWGCPLGTEPMCAPGSAAHARGPHTGTLTLSLGLSLNPTDSMILGFCIRGLGPLPWGCGSPSKACLPGKAAPSWNCSGVDPRGFPQDPMGVRTPRCTYPSHGDWRKEVKAEECLVAGTGSLPAVLKQRTFIVSQSWRVEVLNQGMGRAMCSLTPVGENPPCLSPLLVEASTPQRFRACGGSPAASASITHGLLPCPWQTASCKDSS